MKKFIGIFLLVIGLFIFPNPGYPDTTLGFDFRQSGGFCTDPANHTYYTSPDGGTGDYYPTTRAGFTFGGSANIGDSYRDRDAGIDCRLAGLSREENNQAGPAEFRVDLPATGDWDIRLAMGDATGGEGPYKVRIYDNVTLKATITGTATSAQEFWDASGVKRTSAADWVSNNASITVNFASTTAWVKYGYGDGSTTGNTAVAHVSFTQVSATTTTTTTTTSTTTTSTTLAASFLGKALNRGFN